MVSIALLPHQEWARLSVIQQALPEYYSAYYIINTEGTLSGKRVTGLISSAQAQQVVQKTMKNRNRGEIG